MADKALYRLCGVATATGATVVAAAIALEGFTDPVDRAAHYHHELALPVNLALLLGFAAFTFGIGGVLWAQRETLRTRGIVAFAMLFLGLFLGEVPHTVVDFAVAPQLFERLGHAQAHTLLNDHIDGIVGPIAAAGVLLVVTGVVLFALETLRAGVLPRWAPLVSMSSLAVAVALGVISSTADLAPHAPVALYVGLAAYGLALNAHAIGPRNQRAVQPVTVNS